MLNIAQQVKQHLSTVVPPAVDVAKQQQSSSSSSSTINVVKSPVAHGAIELAEKCLSKAVESKEWQSKGVYFHFKISKKLNHSKKIIVFR